MLVLVAWSASYAASLDNLEIAGPWGSPTATDGVAPWWNPAGVAAGRGTRLLVEGAPTFAAVDYRRSDPHGGADTWKLSGVLPYAGIATDLGPVQDLLPGIGAGAALAVPYARGGAEDPEPGSGRYAMRAGDIRGIAAMGVLAWEFRDVLAVGAGAGVLIGSWKARVDLDTMPDLQDEIIEMGRDPGYTDEALETADYAATLDFDALTDRATLLSAGLRARPHPRVAIGLAWISGARIDNQGDVTVRFGCPPQSDEIGRFGAESLGLCDRELNAAASVVYNLPWRVHGGLRVRVADPVFLEFLGGYVHWSDYRDFEIRLTDVGARNPDLDPQATSLVEQDRLWARDNVDSMWIALDAKAETGPWVFGARVLRDGAAVPDAAVSGNNYDADTVILSALAAFAPVEDLQLGLSASHHVVDTRRIETSGFGMTLDPAARKDDRWFYPHGNGKYAARIDRIGVQVRWAFGR